MNVTKVLTVVLTVLAVAAVTESATAQQGRQPDGGAMMGHQSEGDSMMGQQPQGGSMMGQGMSGSMMGRSGMMAQGGMRGDASMCTRMTGHIEGRLAFLKAELKITSEQESLWNDYAAAVRDNAQAMTIRCASMMSDGGKNEANLPDRLDAHEQFMAAQLDALRATSKALKPLYAALSDTQKQVANQLIRPMGMM
jgi:LTXXQ motif family protein